MSIIYSLICKIQPQFNIIPLCQYDSATGNYPQIIIQMIKQLKDELSKKTYRYNSQFHFHIMKESNMVFIVMTDINFEQKTAFNFLEQLYAKFIQKYSKDEIKDARSHSLNSFNGIYNSLVTEYSEKKTDKKAQLNQKLNNIKGILTQNIQKLLQKQDKVALLVNRSQINDQFSTNIKNNAGRMRNNNKKYVKIGIAFVIILIIIYFLTRGQKKEHHQPAQPTKQYNLTN